MAVLLRSRVSQAAAATGLVALGLFVAVFFVTAEFAKAWVYTVAFFVTVAALILVASARLNERHEKPSLAPKTRLGWWSVGLAAAGLVLAVAVPSILSAIAPAVEGPMMALSNVAVLGFAAAIAAGVTGVVAWFRRAERSVLVLLTWLPALFALYFLIGEVAFPH